METTQSNNTNTLALSKARARKNQFLIEEIKNAKYFYVDSICIIKETPRWKAVTFRIVTNKVDYFFKGIVLPKHDLDLLENRQNTSGSAKVLFSILGYNSFINERESQEAQNPTEKVVKVESVPQAPESL